MLTTNMATSPTLSKERAKKKAAKGDNAKKKKMTVNVKVGRYLFPPSFWENNEWNRRKRISVL